MPTFKPKIPNFLMQNQTHEMSFGRVFRSNSLALYLRCFSSYQQKTNNVEQYKDKPFDNRMYSWQDKLINLSNQDDHETQHALPKQFDSLIISSPGRYHLLLSRTPEPLSKAELDELIKEEYGLDELQEEMAQVHQLPVFNDPGADLVFIFSQSKMVLGGDVAIFKAGKGIGSILGFRTVINDGNTIVEHFWDNSFQYVLLHEIKY